jgi:hypothetical protein
MIAEKDASGQDVNQRLVKFCDDGALPASSAQRAFAAFLLSQTAYIKAI